MLKWHHFRHKKLQCSLHNNTLLYLFPPLDAGEILPLSILSVFPHLSFINLALGLGHMLSVIPPSFNLLSCLSIYKKKIISVVKLQNELLKRKFTSVKQRPCCHIDSKHMHDGPLVKKCSVKPKVLMRALSVNLWADF